MPGMRTKSAILVRVWVQTLIHLEYYTFSRRKDLYTKSRLQKMGKLRGKCYISILFQNK